MAENEENFLLGQKCSMPFSADSNYSWADAVATVLEAYKEFSPKLYKIAKDFFDNNWIDVPPRDGKRSGAFVLLFAQNRIRILCLILPEKEMTC